MLIEASATPSAMMYHSLGADGGLDELAIPVANLEDCPPAPTQDEPTVEELTANLEDCPLLPTQDGSMATVVATTEGCSGADQDSSTPVAPPGFDKPIQDPQKRLEAFAMEVQLMLPAPLLPRPAKVQHAQPPTVDGKPELPKRSELLVNHPLVNVPSSKRAEVVLMRRFGVVPEAAPITNEGKEAYKKFYVEDMREMTFEALSKYWKPQKQN
ncbi:unnamed protein product [Urochloa decumbens]|uniref:Uncharacterized protein n=1 Tax=Urochloa decumbens TaxID=240449 RepID=A0ABC8VF19_9POAL